MAGPARGTLTPPDGSGHLVLGAVPPGPREMWRRVMAVLVFTCLPVLVVGLGWRIYSGEWPLALTRISTHARAFLAIPLLLCAEALVDVRVREACLYLADSGIIGEAPGAYRSLVARYTRIRDSIAAQVVVLVIATVSLFLDWTYVDGAAPSVWGALPVTLVFRFLLVRWLWRWLLWDRLLWGVSRLPLRLRSTHPDRLAGLEPLLGPGHAFAAVVAGGAVALAGGWADLMLRTGVSSATLRVPAVSFAVVAIAVATAPTLSFIPHLYRARKDGLAIYGVFAAQVTDAFESRWFNTDGGLALRKQDISSLCDLGGAYEVIVGTRVVPWSHRLGLVVGVGALAPIVPLFLADVGVAEIGARLISGIF